MKMLFLTPTLPLPPIGGEKIRAFHFLKYLSKTWDITLLTFIGAESEKKALNDYDLGTIRVRTVLLPRYASYLKCLGGLFSPNPLQIAYYSSKWMRQMVKQEIKAEGYDLIFCHLLRMANYVKDYTGIKKVLDLCDALSLRYALSSQYRKGPFKLVEYLEAKRLEKYEPKISGKFDLNFIASFKDKDFLEKRVGVQRLKVIEIGINPADLEFREIKTDPRKIVFFANLRTFHNIDAVKYFYRDIFPLIKEKIKDAKFVIAGAQIPRCILDMAKDSSVSIFSDIADIRALAEDACVSIAPMRIAVGIQNKILQSMAYRVPVVTTSLGLGSIQAKPERDILIADNAYEFANKVIMLMENHSLGELIRENAYKLTKEKYFWPDIVEDLNKKLLSLF